MGTSSRTDPRYYVRGIQKDEKYANLLDRDVIIKKAHGFSDSILENAKKVLRLPRDRQAEKEED